jgi:pimeloyl-ACP methyl ester carboxylesterase
MSDADNSFVAVAQGNLTLPKPRENNRWYQDRGTDSALIFVHGIFSDSRSCWLREEATPVYWPDLVFRDRRFNGYSIYLGGYYTALDAGPFKVQHCADDLFRALARSDGPGIKSAFERERLVFVCHSTGGIVVRYMLETRAAEFKAKTVGLVLIASPSFGSAWATKLSWLSEFYNAQLARQLEWGNDSLDDLDERFQRLINEKRIPRLLGVEAYENHFVFHRKFLPDRFVVVDKNSAGRYFAPAHLLANTDHFTSVKPNSERHPAHELLVDFHTELERHHHQYAISDSQDDRQNHNGGILDKVSKSIVEAHSAAQCKPTLEFPRIEPPVRRKPRRVAGEGHTRSEKLNQTSAAQTRVQAADETKATVPVLARRSPSSVLQQDVTETWPGEARPELIRWIRSVNVIASSASNGEAEALADRLRKYPGLSVSVCESLVAAKLSGHPTHELSVSLVDGWSPAERLKISRRALGDECCWDLDERRLMCLLTLDSRCRLRGTAEE